MQKVSSSASMRKSFMLLYWQKCSKQNMFKAKGNLKQSFKFSHFNHVLPHCRLRYGYLWSTYLALRALISEPLMLQYRTLCPYMSIISFQKCSRRHTRQHTTFKQVSFHLSINSKMSTRLPLIVSQILKMDTARAAV